MPKRRYSMWQDKACYVLYRPFPQKYGRNTPDSKTGKFPCVRTGLFFVGPL